MSVYPGRRPGTYRIVVWSQGKPHEEIFEGGKTAAKAYEAQFVLKLEAGRISTKRGAPRLRSFCDEVYKPHAEVTLQPSTWTARKGYLELFCRFFGDRAKFTEIDTGRIEEYKRWRLVSGVTPGSINTELIALQAVRSWAVEMNVPVADRCKFLPLPTTWGRVKVWTREQVDRILERIRDWDPEFLPITILLLNTGVRGGEACAAQWSWIDLNARMIRIPANEHWRPKNGLPREVPMSDALHAMLVTLKRRHRYVFIGHWGKPYATFPGSRLARVLADLELEGTPHRWRHTFASMFLQQVPDLFLLAQVLGHSQTRVTLMYAHLLPEHLKRARNAVNIG